MLDRIERVTRVKSAKMDVDNFDRYERFRRKSGYEEQKRRSFEHTLDHEMKKETRPQNSGGPGVSDAYALELSIKPTQSLFYRDEKDTSLQDDLRRASREMNPMGRMEDADAG